MHVIQCITCMYIRIISNTNPNVIILHHNIFYVAAVEQNVAPEAAGAEHKQKIYYQ